MNDSCFPLYVSLLLLLSQALAPQQQKETFVEGWPQHPYLTLTLPLDLTFQYTGQYYSERNARAYHGTWYKAGNTLVLTSRSPKRSSVE